MNQSCEETEVESCVGSASVVTVMGVNNTRCESELVNNRTSQQRTHRASLPMYERRVYCTVVHCLLIAR